MIERSKRVSREGKSHSGEASTVLYITNLVRPFTINQLRELLQRTGKIVEDGFWIDSIKSKCYVQVSRSLFHVYLRVRKPRNYLFI